MNSKQYIIEYVKYHYENKGVDTKIVEKIKSLYIQEENHLRQLKKQQRLIDKMNSDYFFNMNKKDLKQIVIDIKTEKDYAIKAIDIVNETLNSFLKNH